MNSIRLVKYFSFEDFGNVKITCFTSIEKREYFAYFKKCKVSEPIKTKNWKEKLRTIFTAYLLALRPYRLGFLGGIFSNIPNFKDSKALHFFKYAHFSHFLMDLNSYELFLDFQNF